MLALVLSISMTVVTGDRVTRCDPAPWRALLVAHAARYPTWSPTDAYKLLHQATLGSEHAVPDPGTAERWMTREIAELGPGPPEPLVDTLGSGGRFARIHLRAWLARHGDPQRLTQAFVATANQAQPDLLALTCALEALTAFHGGNGGPWHPDSVAHLIGRQSRAGHPAIHHSDSFGAAYHPAYRVVALGFVRDLLRSDRGGG